MNKSELVADVVSQLKTKHISATDVNLMVDALINSITKGLKKGDTVRIVGFGSFSVVARAPRMGRNPKTGAEIHIPGVVVPKFKPGTGLKTAVANVKLKSKHH